MGGGGMWHREEWEAAASEGEELAAAQVVEV